MSIFLQLIILFGTVWAMAYYRMTSKIWVPVVGAVFLGLTIFSSLSWLLLIPCWLVYGLAAVLFMVPELRLNYLTKPVLAFFHKALPPMSVTEREALEAGDVWWDGELFAGRPDWQKLLNMKKPALTGEEQAFLDNQAETLCQMLDDWQIVEVDADLPKKVWDYLKSERFFSMNISKEYGGLGFSALAQSAIVTKIATRSVSAAVNTMVPNSLGPGELLYYYGTEEQKTYYLPRLARGEEVPCFALTGPEAGSDAGAMRDSGIVCKGQFAGKEVLGIRLNWDKRYITLAPVATVLGLAFKLYDPDHLLGSESDIGITVCLIPTTHPGVEIGHRHSPLGAAFMNGPTSGEDVFIPIDWIIGGIKMAGQGWRMLMECLSIGRGISLPAISTSMSHLSYRMTGAYAYLRKQFKLSIGRFEGIEEAMARIAGYTYIIEATRVLTAAAVSEHIKPAVVSGITKYHLTELMREVCNDAMDIHAGRAIQLGPRNYLGHGYQTVPVAITVEGANILTRNLIIFGQGAVRCHPYILAEMEAAADTDKQRGLQTFDKLLCSHIGYAVSNLARALAMGFSGARFVREPMIGPVAKYYQQLTRMSTALALVSDVAMLLLGGDLKRKERLSARLGDVLSYLYLASAVLKYYHDQNQPASDLPFINWAMQTLLVKSQRALDEFFVNFPQPVIGKLLRFVVFPLGLPYRKPNDKLGQQLANAMMIPSEQRERLSYLCYIGKTSNDPTGRIEHAFTKVWEAEPLQKKLHAAIKTGVLLSEHDFEQQLQKAVVANVLTAAEAQLIRDSEAVRLDAMLVDDFPFDYFAKKK